MTASASKAFPSSINSSTLSESARSMFDSPCKSPDCPADSEVISRDANESAFKFELVRGARFLDKPTVFAPADFLEALLAGEADLFNLTFFAVVFLEVVFFAAGFFPTAFRIGFPFFAAVLACLVFFLDLFLAAINAVYHRDNQALKALASAIVVTESLWLTEGFHTSDRVAPHLQQAYTMKSCRLGRLAPVIRKVS